MRIYIPLTLAALRRALQASAVQPVGGTVFAVTPDLQAEYPTADTEELEYLAMADAARASLRLLAAGAGDTAQTPADPGDGWLRVVAAADVADVRPAPELDRAAGKVSEPVPWRALASVHIDGAEAADVVRAAAEAVDAADLGDPDAEFTVGTAEDVDLGWYAPDEIRYLLEDLELADE